MTSLHWNVDPVFIDFGFFTIRWYGLFFAAAFLAGHRLMSSIYRAEREPQGSLNGLFIYVLVGVVIGARLGHCLLYDPSYYATHPLEVLEIWKGGLASHGGLIGLLLATYLYSRDPHRMSWLWYLDRLSIPAALGSTLVRFGNFFNSEILGMPTTSSWAVVFDRVDALPRHPVQLYEAIAYAATFVVLLLLYRRDRNRPEGMLTGLFLVIVFCARFVLDFVKTSQAASDAHLPFSVGQLLSIPFIILGLILLIRTPAPTAQHRRA